MRHIDIDSLEELIPDEWKKRAREAYEAIKQIPPGPERSKKIDEYSSLWKDLKHCLKEISYKKCWYCESAGHRIIGDVDHYRPKNRIKSYGLYQAPAHMGYWWLAFDWRNYRYACELCNRLNKDRMTGIVGGKGSFFPLLNERKRVYDECNPYELLQEMPLLLDPTIETDPFLMTFDEDGSAQPASNDKEEELRASVSIKLYHLNHFDLKERRRIDVCHVVREKVKDADMYYWHYAQDKGNVTAREGYHRVVRDLKKMISERAEYSAAARAILKMYRTPDRLWVDKLLTA